MNNHFVGKYASVEKDWAYVNPNVFQFNADSTFLNEYYIAHLSSYAVGKWKRGKGDTLILNTPIKSTVIPIRLKKLDYAAKNSIDLSINLQIVGGLDLKNYHCYVLWNHLDYKKVRCDSLSQIYVNGPVDSLYFSFTKDIIGEFEQHTFPLNSEKFTFNPSLENNINLQVSFKDSLFYYHPFNEEKIVVKKNGIEIFNSYVKKWQLLKKIPKSKKIFIDFDG